MLKEMYSTWRALLAQDTDLGAYLKGLVQAIKTIASSLIGAIASVPAALATVLIAPVKIGQAAWAKLRALI